MLTRAIIQQSEFSLSESGCCARVTIARCAHVTIGNKYNITTSIYLLSTPQKLPSLLDEQKQKHPSRIAPEIGLICISDTSRKAA